MPYAPTNLYPRNVTLEESEELLFLGNIDKNDIIEDAQVELINSEGDIGAIAYPKNNSIYFLNKSLQDNDSWEPYPTKFESNQFPILGFTENNTLLTKFNSMIQRDVENVAKLTIEEAVAIKFYRPANDSYSLYTLIIPCKFSNTETGAPLKSFNIILKFKRDGNFGGRGIADLSGRTFYWNLIEASSSDTEIVVKDFAGGNITQKIIQQYKEESGWGYYDISITQAEISCNLSTIYLSYNEQNYMFSGFWNYSWSDYDSGKGYFCKIKYSGGFYGASSGGVASNSINFAFGISQLDESTVDWEKFKKNFSWRFLLKGRYYDNLVYEGSYEYVKKGNKISYLNISDDKTTISLTSKSAPIFFIPIFGENYIYKFKSYESNSILIDCYSKNNGENTRSILIENLSTYVTTFNSKDIIVPGQYIGIGKAESPADFKVSEGISDQEKINLQKYTKQQYYIKIPSVYKCPHFLRDEFTDNYFIKSEKYPAFFWGEICQVNQEYNKSSKEYTYTIILNNMTYSNFSEDIVITMGTYDITNEVKSTGVSSNEIVFTSMTPYLVAERTISQQIYVTIERTNNYLWMVPKGFPLFYFNNGNRTSILEKYFSNSNLTMPETGSVKLLTNEIYSLESKFSEAPLFFIEIDCDIINNTLFVKSKTSYERLKSFRIKIYQNESLIIEKEDIEKKIDYRFSSLNENSSYRVIVEAISVEGLQITQVFNPIQNKDFEENEDILVENELNYDKIFILQNSIILNTFYNILENSCSIWRDDGLTILLNKNLSSLKINKIINYTLEKNKEYSYKILNEIKYIVNKNTNNDNTKSFPTLSWNRDGNSYLLSMEEISIIDGEQTLIKRVFTNTVNNVKYVESKNNNEFNNIIQLLPLNSTENDTYMLIDILNDKYSHGEYDENNNLIWYSLDLKDINITSLESINNDEIEELTLYKWKTKKLPPSEYITPAVFGIKPNPEENNENIYEVDPEQIWYFNLDTKAENIDFTTTHNVQQTLSQYPRVGLSNANFMSQSITTKLGYLNEDDMYVRDNGEKLTKFAKFANDGNVKILRLPNGYLIPVDIQLNSNVSQYNLVGEPSDITFKWTQVADHETCVLYGWE